MANVNTIRLRRRVLIETYSLFLYYPPGVIAMIAGTEPLKALRFVQRIATRIWEKAEPYNERGQKIDEIRDKLLKPFQGREETIRELYAGKIERGPDSESFEKEQELLREKALEDLNEQKNEACWKGGYIAALWKHQQEDGMEYDDVELSKDLREMFAKCFRAYLEDKLVLPEEEPTDEKEKEKKKLKKPRFVVSRPSGPFGGKQEVPIVISNSAEAEIEYAIGDWNDEEGRDIVLRIEQIWKGERKRMEQQMKDLEEKHGPVGEAPAPV